MLIENVWLYFVCGAQLCFLMLNYCSHKLKLSFYLKNSYLNAIIWQSYAAEKHELQKPPVVLKTERPLSLQVC